MCLHVRVDVTLVVTVSVCVRLSLRSPRSVTVTASTSSGETNISAVRRCSFWGDRSQNGSPYMLSDRFLSVYPVTSICPVCNVRLLWPNGWMDSDETWHAGRPRLWPHCVGWGPSSPSRKGGRPLPNFRPFYCGQTAGCITMPLGTEVGLGPGHIVLDQSPILFPLSFTSPST